MEIDNPFKDSSEIEVLENEESKAIKEINTLTIISDKYKPIVINGVSVPSLVRMDSSDEPYICTTPRKVEDLFKDEIDWLNTNINFILDTNGDFILVTSGNQFVFYQTLLKIQYYIYVHNIPIEFFDGNNENSRYYKIWNIGYLIDNENYDSAYTPKFRITIDFNMAAEVESREHAIKMFNRYTYSLAKDFVKLIEYKVPKGSPIANAKCSARLIFNSIEAVEEWLENEVMISTDSPVNNNIFSFFPKLNPLYLNSKVKTTDTFSFYANPKAWIAQNDSGNNYKSKFNILLFPEFIGELNITTYHSAAKTIEVEMEQLSNRIKALCEKYIYKKS
jgi:hypothetical protein